MTGAIIVACLLAQSNLELETAWSEVRDLCKDKEYVRFDITFGSKGELFQLIQFAAKDGRYFRNFRREDPAMRFGGNSRHPMVVVENSVAYFDGKSVTLFDAQTGKSTKVEKPESLYDLNPGLAVFWRDQREDRGLKLSAFEDKERRIAGLQPEKLRLFTLSKTGEPDLYIEVRMRDGYVTYGWHKRGGSSPFSRPSYQGSYLNREPGELKWIPPKIEKREGSG